MEALRQTEAMVGHPHEQISDREGESRESGDAPLRVRIARSEPSRSPSASIVVGFDRQAQSRTALSTAADLAERMGARLYVVHAVDLSDYPIDPDSEEWEEDARESLAEERAQVQIMLGDLATGWEYHAVRGDPVRALLSEAQRHDALMIVVGSHGEGWRRSLERIFSPSVAHGIINRGATPVLVVCDHESRRHGGAGS